MKNAAISNQYNNGGSTEDKNYNVSVQSREEKHYRVSIDDTQLLWQVPANWILLIFNLALPLYLFTENLLLTLFVIGGYYFYGYRRTRKNYKWTKGIKKLKVFRFFLLVYISCILALFAKVYYMY
jgi:hypothetical protein